MPLLGLEPMASIRPQLLVSYANQVCMYVCMCVYIYDNFNSYIDYSKFETEQNYLHPGRFTKVLQKYTK